MFSGPVQAVARVARHSLSWLKERSTLCVRDAVEPFTPDGREAVRGRPAAHVRAHVWV